MAAGAEENGTWITMSGAHIFIRNGETREEAIARTQGGADGGGQGGHAVKVEGKSRLTPQGQAEVGQAISQLPSSDTNGMTIKIMTRAEVASDVKAGKYQFGNNVDKIGGFSGVGQDNTIYVIGDSNWADKVGGVRTVIRHEVGHRVDNNMRGKYREQYRGIYASGERISAYAATNVAEGFAESYAKFYGKNSVDLQKYCPKTYKFLASRGKDFLYSNVGKQQDFRTAKQDLKLTSEKGSKK